MKWSHESVFTKLFYLHVQCTIYLKIYQPLDLDPTIGVNPSGLHPNHLPPKTQGNRKRSENGTERVSVRERQAEREREKLREGRLMAAAAPPETAPQRRTAPNTMTPKKRSNAASAASPLRRTSPCACRGSIKFVHDDCLLRWIATSHKHRCEVLSSPSSP